MSRRHVGNQLHITELVGARATANPHHVAIIDADAAWTYGEVVDRADRLAEKLQAQGIGPGEMVALLAERSAALVVGALGISKAGAAWVAIDPAYPEERRNFMLSDCGASLVVTTPASAGCLAPEQRVVVVDPDEPLVAQSDAVPHDSARRDVARSDAVRPQSSDDDPAYVVYTSGSTGRPKGVVVSHGGIANLVRWHVTTFGLGVGDRTTHLASPGFDAAVWEIWPCLAAGATLVIVPSELRTDPHGLRDWLLAEQVTVSFVPTVMAETLFGLRWPHRAALRWLLTGGDALQRRPPADLPFTVVNNYGVSEATVVTTSAVVRPGPTGRTPSIGAEIDGVTAEIVDEHLVAVVPGEAGELLIRGASVALGYLHRPELTAERFVPDPATGERCYRTGDLVRRRPDGELDFLGRADEQVTIRGFRVEPGEVTATLGHHPGVIASLVLADAHATGVRLVAYLVGRDAPHPDDGQLRSYLRAFLPSHMVPARFVWLPELPVGANGKVDRTALPVPSLLPPDEAEPSDPIEVAVAAIICELLDLSSLQRDENFFLLGGHSMLGAELLVRLEDLFDVELTLRSLFDGPTVAAIAAALGPDVRVRETR